MHMAKRAASGVHSSIAALCFAHAHIHTQRRRARSYTKKRETIQKQHTSLYTVWHTCACAYLLLFVRHANAVCVQPAPLATALVCCCAQSNATATTATSRCVYVLPMRKQAQCSHTKLRASRSIVHSRAR
jgi:hypothetical protein